MVSHQVALITGASSGIGQAAAKLLGANGFTVFGTSRTPLQQPTSTYSWLALDVRSDTQVEAVVQTVLKEAGRIDVLINNAGYAQVGAIEETSLAEVQAQLDTNLFGVIRLIQAVLPVMRKQGSGRILNVSSVLGLVSPPYTGVYATSKFALEGLTEALREEERAFGIHVSLIEPSFVNTCLVNQEPTAPIAEYTARREAALQALSTKIRRGIAPEVVARVMLQAATTSRPHTRYLAGRADARTLLLLKRLLPEILFERVKRRVL